MRDALSASWDAAAASPADVALESLEKLVLDNVPSGESRAASAMRSRPFRMD